MGGVAGHISHLSENTDLTFGELFDVLERVAKGDIELVEKVDGQNLFFSWHAPSGDIRTARNKGDIAKGGMTPDEFAAKWHDHPAEDAFRNGFAAIEAALSELSGDDLVGIFGDDADNWVNAEVMYVGNPNIINYGANYVVLHNLQAFDDRGNVTDIMTGGAFDLLVRLVEQASVQLDSEEWGVRGPIGVTLDELRGSDAIAKLNQSYASLGFSSGETLGDFVADKLRTGPIGEIPIPVNQQEGLVSLILGRPGAPSLAELKKGHTPETQALISKYGTKTNAAKVVSWALRPVERAVSDFAIELLAGAKSALVVDHDEEVRRMQAELDDSIAKLEDLRGTDSNLVELLLKNLAKLEGAGDVSSSMEGVVFEYPPGSRALYKLTGSFAMVNQIVGRARRMKPIREGQRKSLIPRRGMALEMYERMYFLLAEDCKLVVIDGEPTVGSPMKYTHFTTSGNQVYRNWLALSGKEAEKRFFISTPTLALYGDDIENATEVRLSPQWIEPVDGVIKKAGRGQRGAVYTKFRTLDGEIYWIIVSNVCHRVRTGTTRSKHGLDDKTIGYAMEHALAQGLTRSIGSEQALEKMHKDTRISRNYDAANDLQRSEFDKVFLAAFEATRSASQKPDGAKLIDQVAYTEVQPGENAVYDVVGEYLNGVPLNCHVKWKQSGRGDRIVGLNRSNSPISWAILSNIHKKLIKIYDVQHLISRVSKGHTELVDDMEQPSELFKDLVSKLQKSGWIEAVEQEIAKELGVYSGSTQTNFSFANFDPIGKSIALKFTATSEGSSEFDVKVMIPKTGSVPSRAFDVIITDGMTDYLVAYIEIRSQRSGHPAQLKRGDDYEAYQALLNRSVYTGIADIG